MTELLHNFTWHDLLDIAIVAYIIYRIILLLKGTVAVRLMLAIAVVLVFYFISQFAGLKTFNWILDNFLSSIVLILIIVFQNDLRRSLITIGRDRHSRDLGSDEALQVVEELVSASDALASRNIGALMVVEKEIGVLNYLEVGTVIDAKVTSELITSIFLPYSPIHDGAVLIQQGKLTCAGCFLPLSQNPDISKNLGTRHRAAIGLSELVDAVVLVVSEETGTISLVEDGKITPATDQSNLRQMLIKRLGSAWMQ